MERRVYLDYAAATPVRKEVREAMAPYLAKHFANPSSLYREAVAVKKALDSARERIASLVHAHSAEVVFTSGSTESNNLAIFGVARRGRRTASAAEPENIITTQIEHSSILEPLRALEKDGWRVTRLGVSREGVVDLAELRASLTNTTALVTLAWANPDIGTVQPIREISRICKLSGALVHIDASQAGGMLPLSAVGEAADLVTLSSAKAYGPAGVGVLVVRSGVGLEPLIYGGGQERGIRSGTENVAGAIGCAAALSCAEEEREREAERLLPLRDRLIKALAAPEGVLLTGPKTARLANHASFAIRDAEGEELAVRLDARGFAVGTGSACAAGGQGVSRAASALGIPEEFHAGTLRVTLGRHTGEEDIDAFVRAFREVVDEMRSLYA